QRRIRAARSRSATARRRTTSRRWSRPPTRWSKPATCSWTTSPGSCNAPAISTIWRARRADTSHDPRLPTTDYRLRLLRDRLNRNADLHLVAYQESAGLERRVPVQAEVLAIDRDLGLEAETLIAPRIDRLPEIAHRQRDR